MKLDDSHNNVIKKDEPDQDIKRPIKSRNSKQVQPNEESFKILESDIISASQNNSGIWHCSLCQESSESLDKISFEHKFQLVSHWYETHSDNNVTYEVCQWCMELFTSPGNLTKVR